jgi:tRNA pseudouridine55 synthase
MDGALLVNKHAGVSSFGVIEDLQDVLLQHPGAVGSLEPFKRRRDVTKMGHGGTLDPFATGLLAVCVGKGVKLARYFLGSRKTYEGVIRFGETTIPGDPTAEISERSPVLPSSLEAIQAEALKFTLTPYLQTPPMHSAKKLNGKPLYELAREGIEVERAPKELKIHSFEILSYEKPLATFRVECSSGTYIRTLSQDLAARLGTVGMLDSLNRTASGIHALDDALSVKQLADASASGQKWDQLASWVPFDRLLDGYDRADASPEDALALFQGRQAVLPHILSRVKPGRKTLAPTSHIAIYQEQVLIAVARQDNGVWGLERVFTPEQF